MTDQSESSYLRGLYEAALQNYEKQTGMALDKHPLAERLQDGDSVDSFTSVLREQTQAFSEFWGKDKIIKMLYQPCINYLPLPILVRLSGWYVRRSWVFIVPDPHPIAFPACESNTHRPRCPTFCMCYF